MPEAQMNSMFLGVLLIGTVFPLCGLYAQIQISPDGMFGNTMTCEKSPMFYKNLNMVLEKNKGIELAQTFRALSSFFISLAVFNFYGKWNKQAVLALTIINCIAHIALFVNFSQIEEGTNAFINFKRGLVDCKISEPFLTSLNNHLYSSQVLANGLLFCALQAFMTFAWTAEIPKQAFAIGMMGISVLGQVGPLPWELIKRIPRSFAWDAAYVQEKN